jgi:anion transporter
MTTDPVSAVPRVTANKKWIGLAVGVVIAVAIAVLPTPAGLSQTAHLALAVAVFAIGLWIFEVMNNGISSVLMMGLMILVGVKPPLALSGFSTPAFWILLLVLFYGFAMQRTGLAQRLALYILSLFPRTYAGILWAFFLIRLVLALGVPSMTVRTAIMVPIAWMLVQSLNLPARSRGTALVMITVVEMAVFPGLAFLYGSLNGPVVEATFQTKQIPLSWGSYSAVMTLPTVLMCALIVIVNRWVLKPEAPLNMPANFVEDQMRAIGAIKRTELITGIVIVLSIVFWATARIHHQPSFLIGIFALAVFGLCGIVGNSDISTGVSWTLLLYIGGILSLANIVQEFKIADWLAGYMIPVVNSLAFSVVLVLVVTGVVMLLLRFLDPSAFVAIPLLFLPIVDTAISHRIPPMVLMAPILLASAPFWLTYENFWIAMGEGMTGGQGFSSSQRLRLATVYAIVCVLTAAFSVGYWKMVGIL